MRRPLPLGLSPRSGRSLAPGRLFRAALRAPNIPLTAAPHGVGCEVTRGDPGGGGGALFRRSIDGLPATRPFKVHPRPAHHLPGSPLGDVLIFSPLAPPPFRQGPGHQTRARRSGNGQQRDAFRERAAAAAQHQPLQRRGWLRGPPPPDSVGLASPYLSRELRGAQCVSASVSVSVSVSLSCRVCRV